MIHTDAHTMGRTYKLGVAILVLLSCVLSGGNAQTSTCTSILNCKSCSSNICLQCNDGYATNREGTGCCSKGCSKDADGYHQCNIGNGICTYQDCESGYFGPTCAACGTQIENCDDCDYVSGSTILHCTACGTGYFRTSNNQQCCPEGCDSCNGDVCLTCKVGYFLYLDRCDTCGNNCQSPANGSARCDPVNGHCYYGCLDGWHGSTCNVPCTISRCETCDYIETADFLRCADCENGYYGNNCQRCSENCLVQTQQICNQLGRCDSGCQPGWRLDNCDRRCSNETGMANCLSCERYNFKCTLCQPGFWGPTCQYRCSDNCSPNDLAQHKCNILDGSCDLGCLPGHYQADCRLNCPNCGGGDRCNITTGICLDRVCDPGYYGTACVNQCPPTCAVNPSSNLVCDFNDGSCPNGCQPDYYGAFCQLSCSQYCSRNNIQNGPVCRQSDGYCFSACEAGYYNVNCNATCISRCVDNTCDIISGGCAECDKTNPGYLCPYGNCDVGKFGQLCTDDCRGGGRCLDGICDRYTGVCVGCIAGFYGDYCDNSCITCADGMCNQTNGVCDEGCIDGFFGQTCNNECGDRCTTCNRLTGSCEICDAGTYGSSCQLNCSENCLATPTGIITCSKSGGICDNGACVDGYYTQTCTTKCNDNCLNLACDFMSGDCLNECIIGWYGSDCSGECSSNCLNKNCYGTANDCLDGCIDEYYGQLCDTLCSANCATPACTDEGRCVQGCLPGWFGSLCNNRCSTTCTDGRCDRESGICVECTKPNPSPLCRTAECTTGFFGIDCDVPCPSSNCNDNTCNRETGDCVGCNRGLYGPLCNITCHTCLAGTTCDQIDGKCNANCEPGYYGSYCREQCRTCVTCEKSTGLCITCPPGKTGELCELNCSTTCVPVNGQITCDIRTAACESRQCINGYWGLDCFKQCNSHCGKNADDSITCGIEDGYCLQDCDPRFYGTQCNLACDSFCYDDTCDREKGVCTECLKPNPGYICPSAACQDGFYGQDCTHQCASGCATRCDRYTAKCTTCRPGYWGDECKTQCSSANCYECEQSTGACIACIPGYYGIECQLSCGFCTPDTNGDIVCDKTTGNCLSRECRPGYHGLTCDKECNEACAEDDDGFNVCFINTGICSNGCDVTFYGFYCEEQCSETCLNSDCIASAFDCRQGCAFGYYGPDCNTPCSSNCVGGGCNQTTGACADKCVSGNYGAVCDLTCISTCVDDECDRIGGECPECFGPTSRPDYYCRSTECTDGYWGTFCNSLCPDHCQSTCNRDTSICDACVDGRFGSICNLTCGNCLSGTCDKVSGMCESPCIQGWWGPYCNTTCLYPGCKECDQETGLCTACRIGQFGENCERQCSDKCTPSVDGNVACDRNTGNCEQGSCLPGYYNLNCTGECSPNCFPDNNGVLVCALMTGYCPNGCPPTLTGNFCNEQCSVFCTDNLCYQNGTCQIGCVNNRYGEQCQTECISTCNDNTCDRKSGICEECLKPAEDQTALCRSAECPSGFTGQFCNISCPDNCFSKCNRYTSNCQSCSTGYYGNTCAQDCGKCLEVACVQNNGTCLSSCIDGFYGDRCNQACEYEQCKSCYRDTGSCLECDAGYWGENCEKNCSSQCVASSDGFVYCSKTTGDCTVGACLPGYYTEDCTMSCHENCRPRANGMTYCDFETGRCSNGCLDGFYGDHCNFTCSGNCQGGVCERDGACLRSLGCAIGYYGTMCNSVCVSTCNDNTCNRDEGGCDECKKAPAVQSPLCRSAECNPNNLGGYFHGQLCNISCPDNCASSCGRYTSVCVSCQSGFWSGECDQSCGSCSEVTCFQSNGTCQSDCLDGFYGAMCNLPCKHSGCRTCDRVSGECVVCKPSFWGDNCDRDCSQRCAFSDDGNIYCDKANSNCDLSECQTGFYNLNCTGVCNENCLPLNTGSGVCNFFTGECSYGCFNGIYGPSCQFPCSPTCRESTCDRNGRCNEFLGCDRGFFGFSCENQCIVTCSDGTCDRDSGNCTECGKPAEEQTPLCRSAECPVGLHGLFCNQSCPDNCLDRKCGRYSAICDACVDDFWGTSCDTACGNCVGDKCRQDDGFCENGCDDGYYGDKCMTSCTYEGCQSCGSDGECLDCKPGLFRERCDRTCSRNCVANTTDGNIYCSKQTGACAMQQCTSGFYTPQCTQSCNENCGIKSDGSRSCDIYTGSCDLDCELTYYGQSCDLKCPETCLNQDCDRTGNCRQGCQVGYWDPTCGTECQEAFTCNVGTCDITSGTCLECDNEFPTPLCRTADCPTGLHGLFCNMSCPANCANNICDRYTGLCATCRNGFYGPACESACPNCKNNVCFKTSGECVQGCLDGWYTAKCDQSCLFTGCQNCDRQSGLCIECKAGFYGDNDCNRTCSARCAITDGTPITCNKFSGACDSQQCIAGYWTEQCTRECSQYCQTDTCALGTGTCSPCLVGWYNQRCTGECSDRCRNKNCSIEADLCNQGCTDGFWGGRCENDCSVNCAGRACNKDSAECLNGCIDNLYYGSTCNTPCNGNCIDNVCNTTGYCLRGCEVGYYGDKCQFTCASVSKCVDGTCDRIVGTCSDCLSSSPGPNCPTADCLPGKRGVDCEDDCSSTMCLYNKCDRYGNRCLGCPLQRWGVLCENVCSNCREGTQCDQDTGVCLEGCRDGYYKDDCNTPCRDVCSRCGRQDGVCIECTAGRWGPSCDNICSSNCLPTYDVNTMRVYCDKETAACDAAACQPGYWQANCTRPCGQNCKVNSAGFRSCSLLNGQCDEGCVDTYFGPTCSGVCSERCRNRLCKDFSNSCVLGCAEGYYGSTCGSTCSSQCAGAGGCDPRNGTCYEGCNSGYFGSRCDRQCINSCTDGTCASDGGCDDCKTDPIGPLCRAQVCAAGKYGTTCESDCPGKYCLENKCHRQMGNCELGCLDRYHGQYCTELCDCDFTGTTSCDQNTGNCNCQIGRYGQRCSQTCSNGCIGFRCEKDGQCSAGCNAGRYGIMCDNECNTCVNQACSEGDGTCRQGCVDGWYGTRCDIRCPAACKSCDSSGTCTKCVTSNYGLPDCTGVCSGQCKPNGGDRTCQENSGACIFGCQDGYYGSKCDQACGFCRDAVCQSDGSCQVCIGGYYGRDCKQSCSINCNRGGGSNTNECNQNSGVCTYGCVDGYFGNSCTSECSDNCLNKKCTSRTSCTDGCIAFQYGAGCQQSCPNCNRGNCDDDGFCLEGCSDGFFGQKCTKVCLETCLDDACDVTSGRCADCGTTPKGLKCRIQETPAAVTQEESERLSIGAVAGIAAGCVFVVIVFVILFVCCINYKRKADDAKNEIHLPSDVLERLSTHRSLHSTVSTNYPVARVVGDDQKDFVLF